jgi:hypothetical protein
MEVNVKTRFVAAPSVIGLVAIMALSALPTRALADPPDPVPVAPPAPGVKRSAVALIAAGVAVVGAGVGTAFGVLALQNKSDYRNNPTYSNSDNGNNDAAYADGAIALALAAGVTSLVLYITRDSGSAESTPTRHSVAFSASPLVLPHGAGAGALVRF